MTIGRSSVLREMLEGSNGKVVVKMKVDVALEVFDIFLNFHYSG